MPGDSALRDRARAILAAMTERARWIYAIPRDSPDVRALLEAEGLRCEEEDRAAGVARFARDRDNVSFVVFDYGAPGRQTAPSAPSPGILLLEAEGSAAPAILARVLDATGFLAQSELLRAALDVQGGKASGALRLLAHMIVSWDEDWSDLFLLHLASPDPIARHEAALSLCVAAMVARDGGPARALLGEALRRERFPKLRETLAEAIGVVEAMTGGPVEAGAAHQVPDGGGSRRSEG